MHPLKRNTLLFTIASSCFVPALIFNRMWLSQGMLGNSMTFVRNHTESPPNIPATSDKRKVLFYHHDPESFIRDFADCMDDRRFCRVLYWHIPKTGGSYLASRMYPVFNDGRGYNSREWCCNSDFMKHVFRPNTTEYCEKKLGVYEVRPEQYLEVLQTCQNHLATERGNEGFTTNRPERKKRYISFISVREPIQRSVSAIHQKCNIHKSKLPQDVFDTCQRCNYNDVESDQPFYDKYVKDTNAFYEGLLHEVLPKVPIEIPLYIVDNEQINGLFSALEDIINKEIIPKSSTTDLNFTFHFPHGKTNAEAQQKLCDFGMPSALMKQHSAALDAYHRLWSGDFLKLST